MTLTPSVDDAAVDSAFHAGGFGLEADGIGLDFDERAHTIELKPRVDARLAAGAIAF